jgi:chromosome partitioning protein
MGKIIAVANQKGGVAKTTTCINLGASFVATKRRVLVVDLDPQGNATVGSGIDKDSLELSSYDVLLGKAAAKDVIIHAEEASYDMLPTNGDLTAAEVELMNMMVAREQRLRQALEPADSVMIPMQCEYYALEGLSALLNTIEEIKGSVNPNLEIEGLLRTMYDPRNNLSTDVSGQLILHFGDKVYRTVIPRNVRLAEAPSHGIPALKYDRTSRGAVAYLALAGEILRRSDAQHPQQAAV